MRAPLLHVPRQRLRVTNCLTFGKQIIIIQLGLREKDLRLNFCESY